MTKSYERRMRGTRVVTWLVTLLVLLSAVLPSAIAAQSDWYNFRGSDENIGVTHVRTARDASEAVLRWATALKDPEDWTISISDPILVGENVCVAAGQELLLLDTTGQIAKRGELAGPIDFTCRLLVSDGRIMVPISNGRVQALDADTLQTLWTSEALPEFTQGQASYPHQTQTTLVHANGYLYLGTACADWSSSYYGVYLCIDESTGDIVWQYANDTAGYYWSGAVAVNGAIVFAGDDGNLVSLDAETGQELDLRVLGSPVRSTVVREGSRVFVVSQDGRLHRAEVLQDGSFGEVKSVSFASYSTSAPAVINGRVVVGGGLGADQGYKGLVAVLDSESLTILQQVSTEAEVKSAPLIAVGEEGALYAYFTVNQPPGGLYVISLGENDGQLRTIFLPDQADQNYCMASVMADAKGTLYYTNDSGKLFAIGYQAKEKETSPPEQTTAPSEQTTSSPDKGKEVTPGGKKDNPTDIPKTGDGAASAAVGLLFGLSAVVIAAALYYKNRRQSAGLTQ